MLFAIICTDKSDSGTLRTDNRELHQDVVIRPKLWVLGDGKPIEN